MVTAAASERGVGSDPVTRAVPAPENAWTAPTVAGDPPPKTSARPWEIAPAASCSGALSAPIRWAAPVAVRTAYMPLADVLADVSPPRTMSWPGGPGSTTSRLTGAAICHGSRPDSAAARVPGVPAARAGGGAVRAGPVLRCAPVPCAPVLPLGRIANHATTATTVTASAAATVRLRRTATATCRLPAPGARLPGPGPGGLPGSAVFSGPAPGSISPMNAGILAPDSSCPNAPDIAMKRSLAAAAAAGLMSCTRGTAYDVAGLWRRLQVCFMQAMQYGCMRPLRVSGWPGHRRRGARGADRRGGGRAPRSRAVTAVGPYPQDHSGSDCASGQRPYPCAGQGLRIRSFSTVVRLWNLVEGTAPCRDPDGSANSSPCWPPTRPAQPNREGHD